MAIANFKAKNKWRIIKQMANYKAVTCPIKFHMLSKVCYFSCVENVDVLVIVIFVVEENCVPMRLLDYIDSSAACMLVYVNCL